MKIINRIGIFLMLLLLMAFTWSTVLTLESDKDKQLRLLTESRNLMEDEIFVRAQPLLEEAIKLSGNYTLESEEALKTVYLELMHLSGYEKKYTALLEQQISRSDAATASFFELADFYFALGKTNQGIRVLGLGANQTGDFTLVERYEQERYVFTYHKVAYDDVTALFEDTIQVQRQGLWGIASSEGRLLIPCLYEKISTYHQERAIVKIEGEIHAVDGNQSKIYITEVPVYDFGNLADNRITFLTEEGLYRGNAELGIASTSFSEISTYANGFAAAKMGEKWGIIDQNADWVIDCVYDGVKLDELGRAISQSCVFFEQNGSVVLLKKDSVLPGSYEDAKPFADGYAAVKNNGKWGFIDNEGTLVIDYQYEDAMSFGDHVAAVKIGGQWGYISTQGNLVIEAMFEEAKSFSNGSAPVKLPEGWCFISFVEEY